MEDSSTRRSALPSVRPKPRSSGSATNVALRLGSPPALISRLFGFFNSCQFFMLTVMYFPWDLGGGPSVDDTPAGTDKGTTRLPSPVKPQIKRADVRSEEHTSELQSLMRISYAVFCLKKKTQIIQK